MPLKPSLPETQFLNTDQAISRVGGAGLFQLIAGLTLILTFILSGQFFYGIAYLQDRKNITILCEFLDGHSGHCSRAQACNPLQTRSYSFDTQNGRSNLITEVPDLLCISEAQLSLQATLYFVGFLLGSLVWMRLADFWGRKWLIFAGFCGHISVQLIYLFNLTPTSLSIALFLLGLKTPLTTQISYLLFLEIVGPSYRATACAIACVFDGAANLYLPLLYQFGKSWWILYWLNIALPVFLILPFLLLVKQSPKFFVSVKKFKQARKIYTHISSINRHSMFQNKLEGELRAEGQIERKQNHSLKKLFQNKALRRPLIIIPFIWFTVDFVYYGINLSIGNLKGSIYTNGYISGSAEVISYAISGILANTIGRKNTIIISFMVGGVACLLYESATKLGTEWTYVCILFGKLGAACTFYMVYLITTEMFPTVYRGTVFGIANICARAGGILAPIVDGAAGNNLMYIFGVCGVISSVCSILLLETKGQLMADTSEQEESKFLKRGFNSEMKDKLLS